jgi:Amt family ammonium transporter
MQLRSRSRLDDSLDVFSCHGLAGITGALLTGVFAAKVWNPAGADGVLAGHFGQLGIQAVAVIAAALFAGAGTFGIIKLIELTIGVRATVHEEVTGLDLSEHGEEAYFGGELGSLAGAGISLGDSVVVAHAPEPEKVPLPASA